MYLCKDCKTFHTDTDVLFPDGIILFHYTGGSLKPILKCPKCDEKNLKQIGFWDMILVSLHLKKVESLIKWLR